MKAHVLSDHLSAAPLPALYSRNQAAEALKISVRALDYLVSSGKLASVRIGGRVLISSWELLAFIERQTVRASVRGVQQAVI